MARAVLLMGGNLGDVKDRLRCAQQLINSRIGAVLRCSHCYVSAPWGFEAPQPFMNQVVIVSTDHTPQELLAQIHRIERELGRNRASEAVEKAATDIMGRHIVEKGVYDLLRHRYPQLKEHEAIIDIPEPISFETDIRIIHEDGSISDAADCGMLFRKA